MPIKRPVVTEMDMQRARQIVCSLIPLKRLSEDDAEIVARAIAESIAGGRRQGLEMAQVDPELMIGPVGGSKISPRWP